MSNAIKPRPMPIPEKGWQEHVKENVFQHSWWVFLFIALCFGIYSHAMQKKRDVIHSLEGYLAELNSEKESLLRERDDLLLNINSQSDPAWIELTLKKGLGLVPEGQVKVYFQPDGE